MVDSTSGPQSMSSAMITTRQGSNINNSEESKIKILSTNQSKNKAKYATIGSKSAKESSVAQSSIPPRRSHSFNYNRPSRGPDSELQKFLTRQLEKEKDPCALEKFEDKVKKHKETTCTRTKLPPVS